MVSWIGVREFEAAITRMVTEAEAAAKSTVTKSAALVEKAAKQNFEGTHKRGEPHQGGDKPNVVTGTLRRSIRHEPVRKLGVGTFGTTVGPATIYGRRVELGFAGSQGYPYFGPAVEANRERMLEIAQENWRNALSL